MSNLRKIAQQNKEIVEAQGYSEIEVFTKECRVMNNLVQAINIKYDTNFHHITAYTPNNFESYYKPVVQYEPGETTNNEYPVFFKDCDVRGVPNVVDASLSYKDELIGRWFVPSWMADIVGLVSPAYYCRRNRSPEMPPIWDEAVDAFYAGLQGDLDTAGAFIGGMVLMAEARNGL